jgi:hypothetical protein
MTRACALLAAVLLLAGCRRPTLSPGALKAAVQEAKSLPPCSSTVAGEWPASWPVPVDDQKALRFKILFYPLAGSPGSEPELSSPAGEAILDAGTGKPLSCLRWPGSPKTLSSQRWPAAAESLSMKEFSTRQDALYDKTQAVAFLYNTGRGAAPADAGPAKDYLRDFKFMAEPDLLPYYYRMNPAFWEWLRRVAGDSIPKAP